MSLSCKSKYTDNTRSHSRRVPAPTSSKRKYTDKIHSHDPVRLTYRSAKKQCTEQGGKIEHEFKLVKGFTYVIYSNNTVLASANNGGNSASFPDDKVHTLSSNEHINVENDGKVTTQ